jgi:hypothetical protein
MTESEIIPLVTGPVSALGICLLIGLGAYRIIGQSLVPMLQRAIDRHLDSVDTMAKAHQAEHERILGSLDKIDRKVGGIYARLGDLKESA